MAMITCSACESVPITLEKYYKHRSMNQIRKMMKNKMNVNRVQMNRVTSIIMGTAVALVLFLATGCASVKDHDAVYTPIDYTAEDAVASEIERITQLPEDDCVKALWRAALLVQN